MIDAMISINHSNVALNHAKGLIGKKEKNVFEKKRKFAINK